MRVGLVAKAGLVEGDATGNRRQAALGARGFGRRIEYVAQALDGNAGLLRICPKLCATRRAGILKAMSLLPMRLVLSCAGVCFRVRTQEVAVLGIELQKKKLKGHSEEWPFSLMTLVGARGFEPPTTCTPCKYATRLRYAPKAGIIAKKNDGG